METATKEDIKEVLMKLANIQKNVDFLKEKVEDITLSNQDLEALEETEKDFKEGKTISLEDLEKEFEK